MFWKGDHKSQVMTGHVTMQSRIPCFPFAVLEKLLTLVRNKFKKNQPNKPIWNLPSEQIAGTREEHPGGLRAKPGSSWTHPSFSCQPAERLGVGCEAIAPRAQNASAPRGLAYDYQREVTSFPESCFFSLVSPLIICLAVLDDCVSLVRSLSLPSSWLQPTRGREGARIPVVVW